MRLLKQLPRTFDCSRLVIRSIAFVFFSERTSRANFKDHINTFSSTCRGIDYSGTTSNKMRS